MKEIRLMKTARISVGAEPVQIAEALELHRQFNRNASEILSAALGIERMLGAVISFFLFGQDQSKREFFDTNIMDSDWCSFSAKRKLVKSLMALLQAYTPGDCSRFDQAMARVMRYRNAVAHGTVTYSNGAMSLKYFEGKTIEKNLDDTYWDDVVEAFSAAFEEARVLSIKVGFIQPAELIPPSESGSA